MNIEKLGKGFFEKELQRELLTDACLHCQSINTVELIGYQKYASNFGVPFYPAGKKVRSQCTHCKQSLDYSEMPPHLQERANSLRKQMKTPLSMWTGSIVVLVMVIGLFILYRTDKKEDMQYLKKPLVRDILEFQTENGKYSLMRVVKLSGDTIFVVNNKYEVEKLRDINSLDYQSDTSFFMSDTLYYLNNELQELYTNGHLIGVQRH